MIWHFVAKAIWGRNGAEQPQSIAPSLWIIFVKLPWNSMIHRSVTSLCSGGVVPKKSSSRLSWWRVYPGHGTLVPPKADSFALRAFGGSWSKQTRGDSGWLDMANKGRKHGKMLQRRNGTVNVIHLLDSYDTNDTYRIILVSYIILYVYIYIHIYIYTHTYVYIISNYKYTYTMHVMNMLHVTHMYAVHIV